MLTRSLHWLGLAVLISSCHVCSLQSHYICQSDFPPPRPSSHHSVVWKSGDACNPCGWVMGYFLLMPRVWKNLKCNMPSVAESRNRRANLANKPTGMVVLCDGATEATLKYEQSSKIYDEGSAGWHVVPLCFLFCLFGRQIGSTGKPLV